MVESVMLSALPAIPVPNRTVLAIATMESSRLMRCDRTQVRTEQVPNFCGDLRHSVRLEMETPVELHQAERPPAAVFATRTRGHLDTGKCSEKLPVRALQHGRAGTGAGCQPREPAAGGIRDQMTAIRRAVCVALSWSIRMADGRLSDDATIVVLERRPGFPRSARAGERPDGARAALSRSS